MHVVASRLIRVTRRPSFSHKKKPSCISKDRFPNRGQALGCSYKFRGFLFKYNWWFTCTGEQGGETLKMKVDSACCKVFKRCEAQQKREKKWIKFFSTVASCRDYKCLIPTGVREAGSHCAFSSGHRPGFPFRVSKKHCPIRVLRALAGLIGSDEPKISRW